MKRGHYMLLAFGSAALVACDPIGAVDFAVTDPSGAPLEGANVTMTCPNETVHDHALTGKDGMFHTSRIPSINPACAILIEKDGYASRSITVAQAGYHASGGKVPTPPKIALEAVKK